MGADNFGRISTPEEKAAGWRDYIRREARIVGPKGADYMRAARAMFPNVNWAIAIQHSWPTVYASLRLFGNRIRVSRRLPPLFDTDSIPPISLVEELLDVLKSAMLCPTKLPKVEFGPDWITHERSESVKPR
jgi:hypothetical protein